MTRINIFRHGDALEAKSEVSKLWMIDLEGSKQLLKTGAKELTLDEGRAINLSLLALGDVVAALKRKRCHVPFRYESGVDFSFLIYVLLAARCYLYLKKQFNFRDETHLLLLSTHVNYAACN